ncbi:MAG: hypothetical protein RBS34_16300 [Desulfofustis sp.]|jgi:hypothetical protein|nr:hypothetical protein [Desulfofustis sp.]
MDGTFVKTLADLMRPEITEVNGIEFSNKTFAPIFPPTAVTLSVHTLSAVVDYCEHELDPDQNYVVHVESFDLVSVYSQLEPIYRFREELLRCTMACDPFPFGKQIEAEQFVIKMQAQFVQDDTTARILALVGNLTSEAKTTVEDDGVTQRVSVRVGIAKTGDREVPNPVTLRPYRTFPEIQQPASEFVLRTFNGNSAALFEADGGAWKNEAIKSIAEWLCYELKERPITAKVVILA